MDDLRLCEGGIVIFDMSRIVRCVVGAQAGSAVFQLEPALHRSFDKGQNLFEGNAKGGCHPIEEQVVGHRPPPLSAK